MKPLYPLKFKPILKSTLWGGTRLGEVLNKPIGNDENVGESWEVSGVDGNISVVAEGELKGESLVDLINTYEGEFLGHKVFKKFGNQFPLLVKFIDANQDLSIQVHPNDELAKKRHNSFGKTEMWYVVDSEKGATLISGFNKQTNKEEYLEYFNSGKLLEILNRVEVDNDDVFYLPSGRVHTIGKGLLIAEIQQTSDITYRIYDFDRVDKDGNSRELHVEQALDAIDFNYYDDIKTPYDRIAKESILADCNYFITNRLVIKEPVFRNYQANDSFAILMVLEGSGKLWSNDIQYDFNLGDTYLIPASFDGVEIIPETGLKLLEIYLPY
ncbi:MAG: type I phosphomannose isomerase catalytic subunit [Bacteroidota bacterium]